MGRCGRRWRPCGVRACKAKTASRRTAGGITVAELNAELTAELGRSRAELEALDSLNGAAPCGRGGGRRRAGVGGGGGGGDQIPDLLGRQAGLGGVRDGAGRSRRALS